MTASETVTGELADLITALRTNRDNLRHTVRGLDDEQAGLRTTVSALTLGGLVKHLAHGERQWMDFAVGGPGAMFSGSKPWSEWDADDYARYSDGFRLTSGETLAGVLADYEKAARRTDELAAGLDLNAAHPLPEAPWFPPGGSWSVRMVLLHLISETAQHAGHADIIREALDGQKTMG